MAHQWSGAPGRHTAAINVLGALLALIARRCAHDAGTHGVAHHRVGPCRCDWRYIWRIASTSAPNARDLDPLPVGLHCKPAAGRSLVAGSDDDNKEDKPPKLRLVSGNPNAHADRETDWAKREAQSVLSQFAAALLRTTAGNDTESAYLIRRLALVVEAIGVCQKYGGSTPCYWICKGRRVALPRPASERLASLRQCRTGDAECTAVRRRARLRAIRMPISMGAIQRKPYCRNAKLRP